MKNSGVEWIGEIPDDWEVKRGKNIFSQRTTKGNSVEEQLAATQQYGMYPQKLLEGVVQVKEDTDLQQFKTVHKNDYVISLRSFQGGFEMSDYEGVCSPAYQVFYNKIPINYRYYKYLFKSDGFISKMNSLTVGIREGKNIQYKDFSNSLLLIPPKETQQKIASYLDSKCSKIEETIQNQQQVIEKLKAYKQSLITEAVTGKIKIQNGKACGKYESYKDSGVEWIGKIPNMWKKCKFGRIITDTRNGLSRRDLNKSIGNIVLKLKNISPDGNIDLSEINRIELTKTEIQNYKLLCNDFLFVRVNGSKNLVGKCAIYNNIEEIVAYNDHIIRVRFNLDLCNVYYIKFLLQSSYARYDISNHIKTAAGQFTISSEDLCNLICLLPTKDEQKEIANYLDKKCIAIDTAIEQKHKLIEKLTEYKKPLIYEYVTGKKEI